jgi:hypothetical protein
MSEEKSNSLLKQFLKVLGIIAVIFVVLVVVGFGLLVGICGTLGRH